MTDALPCFQVRPTHSHTLQSHCGEPLFPHQLAGGSCICILASCPTRASYPSAHMPHGEGLGPAVLVMRRATSHPSPLPLSPTLLPSHILLYTVPSLTGLSMRCVVMVEGSPRVVTFRARSTRGRCVAAPGREERRPFVSGFLSELQFLPWEAAWLSGSSLPPWSRG